MTDDIERLRAENERLKAVSQADQFVVMAADDLWAENKNLRAMIVTIRQAVEQAEQNAYPRETLIEIREYLAAKGGR